VRAKAVADGNRGEHSPGLLDVTNGKRCAGLADCPCGRTVPGNSTSDETVPETDTGGLVEHTKALERTMPKELGKLLA
jgi:hypothetical protein